jgi:cobyrinic acid a,c-diamide synthase
MNSLMIAASTSGSGKTTVTLGLLAALRRRGVTVRAAKVGPDYIDPAFHSAACGVPSYNLDSWAMPQALLATLLTGKSTNADKREILIIESAMGLFDGVTLSDGESSAPAALASRFGIPVVLVLDVSAQSQTAAAVAHGLATYDPNLEIAGIILNRVAGERHAQPIIAELERRGFSVLGVLPYEGSLSVPERHLGLVQAQEHPELREKLEALADVVERHVDLEALLGKAKSLERVLEGIPPASQPTQRSSATPTSTFPPFAIPPIGQRIALAQDEAFSFIYPHVLDLWRENGVIMVPFSPLNDEPPSEECDACWLPGGYPELHAARLAAATRFRDGLIRFAERAPVYGECGGYMVLGQALEDAAGVLHPMTGLLGHVTSVAKPKLQIGYREAHLLTDSALGRRGTRLRGHEFHYATVIHAGDDSPFATMFDAYGNELGAAGGRRGNVCGSFFHLIAPVV